MPTPAQKLAAEIAAKRVVLQDFLAAAKAKGEDGRPAMTDEEFNDFQAKRAEIDDLGEKYAKQADLEQFEKKNADALADLDRVQHPTSFGGGRGGDGGGNSGMVIKKSLGQLVCEHPNAAEWRKAAKADRNGSTIRPFTVDLPEFDTKTTMTETSAGFSPPNYRTNIVVLSAQRRPVVADLIPQDPTDLQTFKYMEETTFTNNAAMTAEASTAGESAFAFTERSVTVEWLPVFVPITEQQLADVPGLEALITNRLSLQIALTEETQLLSGSGTSPQLRGLLNGTNLQTQAQGNDSPQDAILKAMTLVRFTAFANPSGVVIHPNNWQAIRLIKTTIGSYLFGDPATPGPQYLWGAPVVVTPAITANTALTGDFQMFAHISRRLGLTVDVGFQNDDFVKGKRTLRAQERLGLEIYRSAAFCQITGLDSAT